MTHAFSEYLPHFALTPRRRATDFGGRMQPLGAADAPPADGPAEAEARGRAQGLAEARAEFEAIRANDLAEFETRLAAKEHEFTERTANVLAERLTQGLAQIEEAVSGQTAIVLSRFLETAIRTRAVAELSETVAVLLVQARGARVRVNGPEALVGLLRERLADHGDIEFEVTEAADLSVAIDDTIIETQIAAWEERLEAAFAEGAAP